MSKPAIFVLMHELPVESAGGGVLLREILRHFTREYCVTAFFPVNSFQKTIFNELVPVLASEGIRGVGLSLRKDWGRRGFTLKRVLSSEPGCVCAMVNEAAHEKVEELSRQLKPARWLLISPFATAYLPKSVKPEKVRLYYTNVDEDIMVPVHGTLRHRVEGWVEKLKVRRYVRQTAGFAGKRAAITENNAKVLTFKTGLKVSYVPPLMAPRALDRSVVQPGLALITTNYTYSHNRKSTEWFFREVWPKVGQDVQLEVTGMDNSSSDLRELCAGSPRVNYLGFLSKSDLDNAFQRCAIVINPTISGSGFQIKMLDALARGIPVVSTAFSNPLGQRIPSSDDPRVLADLIHKEAFSHERADSTYNQVHNVTTATWGDWLVNNC